MRKVASILASMALVVFAGSAAADAPRSASDVEVGGDAVRAATFSMW